MTEPPLPAKLLLRAAQLFARRADHQWIDAMWGDLDEAHARGHATRWALGCLVASVRLRAAHGITLTPGRRQGLIMAVLLVVFLAACGALGLLRHPFNWVDWTFWLAMGGLCAYVFFRSDRTAAWMELHPRPRFRIRLVALGIAVLANLVALYALSRVFWTEPNVPNAVSLLLGGIMLVVIVGQLFVAPGAGGP